MAMAMQSAAPLYLLHNYTPASSSSTSFSSSSSSSSSATARISKLPWRWSSSFLPKPRLWLWRSPSPVCSCASADPDPDLDLELPLHISPLESFLDLHLSSFDLLEAPHIPSILSAGSLPLASSVLVLLGSLQFVDQLCLSCSASVEVAHFSLDVLAGIKETHDDVRCFYIHSADLSEVSGSFDTIFLSYLPMFTESLTNLLDKARRLCKPGGTIVISLPQDQRRLQSLGNQTPGILQSSLPNKTQLAEMLTECHLEMVGFQDEPDFYLAVLKFTGTSHVGGSEDVEPVALCKDKKEFPLLIRGEVIRGLGRGSKQLGFPTANLCVEDLPAKVTDLAKGVYYGWAQVVGSGLDCRVHQMVMNVGYRPTFDDSNTLTLEVHILYDYGLDFYGKELRVAILGFIRKEIQFSSIDELIKRIQKDIKIVQECLSNEDMHLLRKDPFFFC